ncbi:Cysteine-rich protein 2-binding protein [Rhodosporidiobolus nylandii]
MEKPEAFLGNFVVRPMKRGDVDEVKRLQDDCLPTSCPPVFYTSLLTSPTSLCLLAYSPSSPSSILGCISASLASYSSLHSEPTPPSIYIFTLAVAPSARQQGLAYHLIRAVVKALLPKSLLSWLPQKARVKLHVEATNVAARRLYRKLGLEEKARARGFYRRLQGGGSGEAIEMEGVLTV